MQNQLLNNEDKNYFVWFEDSEYPNNAPYSASLYRKHPHTAQNQDFYIFRIREEFVFLLTETYLPD